jgi:hypothetical protein
VFLLEIRHHLLKLLEVGVPPMRERAIARLVVLISCSGGWWHFKWGGLAHSNDWNGIIGMVSNTSIHYL